ncbi:hypothetical protein BK146_05495 [Paenibacillus sp. FSL R7-0333]|nr:hypothetical protein BK146_05495 [Paenibacillus sp. FSL R7-0333]
MDRGVARSEWMSTGRVSRLERLDIDEWRVVPERVDVCDGSNMAAVSALGDCYVCIVRVAPVLYEEIVGF